MNKKLLLCTVFSASCAIANAQAPYLVTTSTETYSPLTGATTLTYSATDDGYYYTSNFTFKVFNRTADFKQYTTPKNSNGGFMASGGYLAIYEAPAFDNTIALQCMYIDSFRTVPGITNAYGKTEGASGNRILKLEWNDLVYGSNTARRANFQVWLHESDGSISYHYGPNTLANPIATSAYVGTIVFNPTFTALVDQFSLSGNLSSVQTTFGGTSMGLPKLNSVPVIGTVITLKKNTTSVNELHEKASVTLYPNPAQDYITVTTANTETIYIYQANGQLVKTATNTAKEQRIDISDLTPGVYHLTAGTGTANFIVY